MCLRVWGKKADECGRVREVTRMTMMASAPAAPSQQGGALRGFGVLGNRVRGVYIMET